MNARYKIVRGLPTLYIANAYQATAMSLCMALITEFGFAPNGRCARFSDELFKVWVEYYSKSKATRYETQIRVMCIQLQADSEKEIDYRYRLREKRSDDADVQDFLFMAAVMVLHDSFGFHTRGIVAGEPSSAVKRLMNAYNETSTRWNKFNRDMKNDMMKHPGQAEEYKIDMLGWMADRLRGMGMCETVLNEKVLRCF